MFGSPHASKLGPTTSKVGRLSWQALRKFGYALVPQYIRSKAFHDPLPASRTSSTAFLDGLRGVAALIVFNFHFLFAYRPETRYPWSSWEGYLDTPLFEFWFSGLSMVSIFFVVSGYAISLKPLQLMHSDQERARGQLLNGLSSSVFRRAFRLFLPVLAWTFLLALLVQLGYFEPSRIYAGDENYLQGNIEKHPPRMRSLFQQMEHWWDNTRAETYFFNWGNYYSEYDIHLWTIPVEYRTSILLYCALLALARAKPIARIAVLGFLDVYSWRWGRADFVLYFSGAVIAEINVCFAERSSVESKMMPSDSEEMGLLGEPSDLVKHFNKSRRVVQNLRTPLLYFGVLVAAYFLSAPKFALKDVTGFTIFSQVLELLGLDNEGRWFQSYGAIILLACLLRMDESFLIRRLLSAPSALYMGHISFSFYIVHGAVLHGIGYVLVVNFWKTLDNVFGPGTQLGWCLGLMFAYVICLLITLCVADVFCREVEQRCITFTKQIESLCFVR